MAAIPGIDIVVSSAGLDRAYGDAGTDTYNASGLDMAATIDLLHGKATQGAGNITYLDSYRKCRR